MSEPSHKYLRVQDLRRLRHLLFTSRRPVEGLYAGRHASPQRGHSVEFSDYRPYMPGDELGDIDWKVYGRSDKLFIKMFEHQSDMTVHLVVDASASMGYCGVQSLRVQGLKLKAFGAGGVDSKYDHACRLAASIAFLVSRQQDRVSLSVAQEGLLDFHRPLGSPTHLLSLLTAMERVQPGKEARLADAVEEVVSRVKRRGVMIVFSDLLDEPEPVLHALSQFRHRGGEVVVFHVLHPDELKLPEIEDGVFIDSESHHRVSLNVSDIREDYGDRMQSFLRAWAAGSRARGFDYQLVNTGTDYSKSLERYLFARDQTR